MRIALATAHPFLPEIAGGAQSSMDETARQLLLRGHQPIVVAGLIARGLSGIGTRLKLKLRRSGHVVDTALGYPVARSWFPWEHAAEITRRLRPDVVVVQSGLPARMAHAFRATGVPTLIHFRNVEADDLTGIEPGIADGYIANSRFTAGRLAPVVNAEPDVIPPIFHPERYRVDQPGDAITLVNPHPHKGLDLAIAIARLMPEYPFLFVRTWTASDADARALQQRLDEVPNIQLAGPFSDMRAVYQQTRLLLAPSQWEEAWGRVASEAHFSGIPVLASNRGGLPEAVGPGGTILPHDAPPECWADEIRKFMDEPAFYAEISRRALDYSTRPEISLDAQMSAFIALCQRHANRAGQSRA